MGRFATLVALLSASIGGVAITPAAEAIPSCMSNPPGTHPSAQSPVKSPAFSYNDGVCGKQDLLADSLATSGSVASTFLTGSVHREVTNDPDAPKSTPTPATLLLVGATFAALGIAARRRAAARRGQVLESDIAGG
ncbi:MAG: hypothetical protein ACREKJ_00215 [Candidatus Rokuibacteriota bacterium]